MKIVREHINEKFTEKSDPIEDMGIEKINFKEEFNKQYFIPERKIYNKWEEFINQFKGKIIVGKFAKYIPKVYEPTMEYAEVKFEKITMNVEGILNLEVDGGTRFGGSTYCMVEGESYQIKEDK
jgi:hypothetical protein